MTEDEVKDWNPEDGLSVSAGKFEISDEVDFSELNTLKYNSMYFQTLDSFLKELNWNWTNNSKESVQKELENYEEQLKNNNYIKWNGIFFFLRENLIIHFGDPVVKAQRALLTTLCSYDRGKNRISIVVNTNQWRSHTYSDGHVYVEIYKNEGQNLIGTEEEYYGTGSGEDTLDSIIEKIFDGIYDDYSDIDY